jgi:hypothetical protein
VILRDSNELYFHTRAVSSATCVSYRILKPGEILRQF